MLRLQEIYDLAADEGWQVDRKGPDHFRLVAPEGEVALLGPSSPSDLGAVRLLVTDLLRGGLDVEQIHAERNGLTLDRPAVATTGPAAGPTAPGGVRVPDRSAYGGRDAANDERRKRLQEAGLGMATRPTNGETAADRVARLRREAAETAAKLQAEIEAAELEVELEEAAGSFARINDAVQAGEVGSIDDWVAVLGLAPDEAIRAAGMLVKGTGDRSSRPGVPGTRAPRLGLDEVTAKLPSVPFTVADLAGSIDREVATARNYVPKLLEAGIIIETGVDESAPGPRKPRLYTRT